MKVRIRKIFHSGKNGIAGICQIDGGPEMIFKTVDFITNNISHEHDVMASLETLKLPNFCKLCGPKKIVRKFSDENLALLKDFEHSSSDEKDGVECNFEDDDEDGIPREIIFEEIAGKISLDDLIQDGGTKPGLASVYVTLLALDIAQKEKRFTHGDLHPSNIFLQEVPENSVFLYHDTADWYLVPSYGYLPIVIDYGFSMIKECEGCPVRFTTEHYHYGYQYSFDPLEDVTHLIIFSFFYLKRYPNYRNIYRELLRLFRTIPMETNGWKELPNDLVEQVLHKMRKVPGTEEYDIFADNRGEMLECLNYLLDTPFKDYKKYFFNQKIIQGWFLEFGVIYDYAKDLLESRTDDDSLDNYLLYCLDILIKVYRRLEKKSLAAMMKEEFISNFADTASEELKNFLGKFKIRGKVNWKYLIAGFKELKETISSIYALNYADNDKILKESYEGLPIRTPHDMFLWLAKRSPMYFHVNPETIVYCYDGKKYTQMDCKALTTLQLEEVNTVPFVKKGKCLAGKILK